MHLNLQPLEERVRLDSQKILPDFLMLKQGGIVWKSFGVTRIRGLQESISQE